MKLTIDHHTQYHYAEMVRHSTQYLRLTPQTSQRQRIVSWQLDLPEQATITTDGYGNILHVLSLDTPHETIQIHAHGEVEILEDESDDAIELISPLTYLRSSSLTHATAPIRLLAQQHHDDSQPLVGLQSLMQAILEKMPYTPGATDVSFSADEALAARNGVCQDHTHVFLACCRSVGIPARYVSGYLYSPDSAHVAMHAWAEVWLNDRWNTFDITNNTCSPNQHLKLAVGMDYLDACPVRGVRFGGGSEAMQAKAAVNLLDVQQQQ
jgi:Transglutaminase-like enzymes, putative cysteine proteases